MSVICTDRTVILGNNREITYHANTILVCVFITSKTQTFDVFLAYLTSELNIKVALCDCLKLHHDSITE